MKSKRRNRIKSIARKESEIFNDLVLLCTSPGYAHVIAFYCLKDTVYGFSGEINPDDMSYLYSYERLIRNEISTLIGIMYKKEIDLTLPDPDKMQYLIEKTDSLLREIHFSMMDPLTSNIDLSKTNDKEYDPFANGLAMREPIFYGSESAYSFQYPDFALKKYDKDDNWLIAKKGFSIKNAIDVIKSINEIQNMKLTLYVRENIGNVSQGRNILSSFIFTLDEVVNKVKLEKNIVYAVLKAFVPPKGIYNQDFNALSDFNITNAYPIIKLGDDKYLLFQQYSLLEALYETPFYWLNNDKEYYSIAMKNRGTFTEIVCKEKLEKVFGKNRVFTNIDIIDSKKNKAGEIDVLVVFADRAIILQAKSKRLTIEARKGNDKVIKDDFKKSIQDSYDQALLCSKLITNRDYKLQDNRLNELVISRDFKEIYIFCVVSDHYPALSFQAREFLRYEQSEVIMPPFVMDIFLLDVMVEMLGSPLQLLSYINRRVLINDSIMAPDELTILSYHLKSNLWIDDKYTLMLLHDDVSVDLDTAMLVRRAGLPGASTPEGILTQYKGTVFDKLIREIEGLEDPGTIELGFMLLKLNGNTIEEINRGITTICERAKNDSKHHDFTCAIDDGKTGLTVHCNYEPIETAGPRLDAHCELRKYSRKAKSWFGISIEASSMSLKFGLVLNYGWEWSKNMENALNNLPSSNEKYYLKSNKKEVYQQKIGRNEPCPCGSGKKYKKCCGA